MKRGTSLLQKKIDLLPSTTDAYDKVSTEELLKRACSPNLKTEVAEAKKAFLVRTCCPYGARKGAKKNILLATTGQKKQRTSKVPH